jgi:hypothetical protein
VCAVIAVWVRRATRSDRLSTAWRLFDLAILAWGMGSLAAAIGENQDASRLADGNVFGSIVPVAVVLDGLSILLLAAAWAAWFWNHRTGRWAGLGLAATTCVVLLALGEFAMRLQAVVVPRMEGFPTYRSALWRRRYVRLNRAGFRDGEQNVPPAEAPCRVATIGDSFAFGIGIARVQDRFGEQLAGRLADATHVEWRSINASRSDTHTLDHIGFLQAIDTLRPDVVVLLYVFNDIDYLHAVTPRGILTEAPRSIVDRLRPERFAFRNSFLVQRVYLLWRLATEHWRASERATESPYKDTALVARHLADLSRFVETGTRAGAVVRIVPIDATIGGGGYAATRYREFVAAAMAHGLPVLSLAHALAGEPPAALTLSKFDSHANVRAYRLATAAIGDSVAAAAGPRPCLHRGASARAAR